ncbi:MAG: hypothetical protein M5U09_18210 [Gammaproteobacteria bacterium]|nr:hypothetical protein [Gammaproteobacteria bacterium]
MVGRRAELELVRGGQRRARVRRGVVDGAATRPGRAMARPRDRRRWQRARSGERGRRRNRGMGYWFYCFSSSMDLACAAAAVGRDELLQHPVWPKCSQFPIHFLWPDRSGMVNFGDSAEKGLRSAHPGTSWRPCAAMGGRSGSRT